MKYSHQLAKARSGGLSSDGDAATLSSLVILTQ